MPLDPKERRELGARMHAAIAADDPQKIAEIVSARPEALDVPAPGTWLHWACGGNKLRVAKELVRLGVGVEGIDVIGETPLIYAAAEGNLPMVKWLIKQGADPNGQGEKCVTPLIRAAGHGHADVVEYLLGLGVDTQVRTTGEMKLTAFDAAEEMGGPAVQKLLAPYQTSVAKPAKTKKGSSRGDAPKKKKSRRNKRTLDFDDLRSDLVEASRAAIDELRAAHPDEHFYAFALFTDDGVAGISPAANTEEGLAGKIASYKFKKRRDINYLRWSTGEWVYEAFGWEHFKESHHAIMAVEHPEDDEDAFPRFRQRILDLMIDVLAALDAEGVFGNGRQREQITLLCSLSDSDDEMELLDRSVRALNPPSVVARYEKTRMG